MPDFRMPDVNRVTLAGRLTRDPELRYIPSGMAVCKLGLAVSRVYKKDAEKKEETLFINVTCWGKTAEYVNERLRKGHPVLVEGSLRGNEYEDKSGVKRYAIDVNAERVQQLTWDRDKDDAPEPKAQAQPEDDGIPF